MGSHCWTGVNKTKDLEQRKDERHTTERGEWGWGMRGEESDAYCSNSFLKERMKHCGDRVLGNTRL